MLNKALRKRSTEKARRKVLKKTLRKVILLNEVLKIVFLLNKAFPKKMILECTNIFKKVLKKAIQKAVKEKISEKKYSEKLFGSRVGSKKLFFSKKTLNKAFFCQKGNTQKSIPSRGYSLEIYISFVEREIQCSMPGWTPLPLLAEYCGGPPSWEDDINYCEEYGNIMWQTDVRNDEMWLDSPSRSYDDFKIFW